MAKKKRKRNSPKSIKKYVNAINRELKKILHLKG